MGSLRLQSRLCFGADYAPSGLVLLAGCALLPCLPWAQKCARCRVCRGLPLRPVWSWAQAVLRLSCPLPSCPLPLAAASRYTAPLQKRIKTAPKSVKKRQKARFLCGISPQASLYASTDSTLISPTNGAYWAAVDAAQSPKRYLKPSTWWGAAPFRAGGKAPMPPHSRLLPRATVINVGRKEPSKEPKNHQQNQRTCAASTPLHQCALPLEWLLHRLTRRTRTSTGRAAATMQPAALRGGAKAPKRQQKAHGWTKSKHHAPFV